jgi:hypothetical protein
MFTFSLSWSHWLQRKKNAQFQYQSGANENDKLIVKQIMTEFKVGKLKCTF